MSKTYIAIDLKSFYASFECIERNLDPMDTNLVVADESRTDKTICLAVSPSLKSLGIPGRPRLFEVKQKVGILNGQRKTRLKGREFKDSSIFLSDLKRDKDLKIDFLVATPQMSQYINKSIEIYKIYLKWVSKEDIHVYSIDEVFIDATEYLKMYNISGEDFASLIVKDVLDSTSITARAGVGTNLYLCKIAMDILAPKSEVRENGTQVAYLDEMSYRRLLWDHKPITDFWRVGSGYRDRLEKYGLETMGDIARMSIDHEDILYNEFGVNGELLIDHAWGYESCTMEDIKSYTPDNNTISTGQVLQDPYTWDQAKVVVIEMIDNLVLELVKKELTTDKITIKIGYDRQSLEDPSIEYSGEIKIDPYGRSIPKSSRGVYNIGYYTSSRETLINGVVEVFEKIVNKNLYIRRLTVVAGDVKIKSELSDKDEAIQLNLFEKKKENHSSRDSTVEKEERLQKSILDIKNTFGKNAILKGTNFRKGATGRSRNEQIGGHKG